MDGFGKAKYGNGSSIKYFDLKTDPKGGTVTYTFRLLPPVKSYAATGIWAKYYGQHFGWKGIDKNNPGQTHDRPFKCIEERNFKTGMITLPCPTCQFIASHLAEREFIENKAKADTSFTGQMVKALQEETINWKKSHNCDRKWNMNAANPQWEFGVLRMAHDVKKLLEAKIKEVKDRFHIDPLDPAEGVWFRFTRAGARIGVVTTVDFEMEDSRDAQGNISSRLKRAPMSQAQIEQALAECVDLSPELTPVVQTLSKDQMELMVKSNGDPETVDQIWAMGEKRDEPVQAPRSTPAPQSVVKVTAPEPKPEPKVEAKLPEPVAATVDPRVAPLKAAGLSDAQIAAVLGMSVAVPAAPVVVATPTPTPAPAAVPEVGLSKDRFFNMFKEEKK